MANPAPRPAVEAALNYPMGSTVAREGTKTGSSGRSRLLRSSFHGTSSSAPSHAPVARLWPGPRLTRPAPAVIIAAPRAFSFVARSRPLRRTRRLFYTSPRHPRHSGARPRVGVGRRVVLRELHAVAPGQPPGLSMGVPGRSHRVDAARLPDQPGRDADRGQLLLKGAYFVITVVFLFGALHQTSSLRTAAFVSLLAALYSFLVHSIGANYSDGAANALFLIVVYAINREIAGHGSPGRNAFLAGACYMGVLLAHFVFSVVLPMFAGYVVVKYLQSDNRSLRRFVVMTCGFFAGAVAAYVATAVLYEFWGLRSWPLSQSFHMLYSHRPNVHIAPESAWWLSLAFWLVLPTFVVAWILLDAGRGLRKGLSGLWSLPASVLVPPGDVRRVAGRVLRGEVTLADDSLLCQLPDPPDVSCAGPAGVAVCRSAGAVGVWRHSGPAAAAGGCGLRLR